MTPLTLWSVERERRVRPHWSGTLDQRYLQWRMSPDGDAVYNAIAQRATALRKRGFVHFGIAALFEAARYDRALQIGPDAEGYKLNNSWRSRLARELMDDFPQLRDFFETRELTT